MVEFPVNPILPDDMLAKRAELSVKPDGVILSGKKVRLQPLDLDRDIPMLYARSNGQPAKMGSREIDAYDPDEAIWRYMSGGPFADESALRTWLQAQVDNPTGCPLAVYDVASDSPVGVANLMSNVPAHLSIELGNIWYSPLVQRMGVNTESTYLMLKHVFDLGYRRVVWKCDALNARSRKSALRFGFKFEGIHEAHYIIKNRNRDTAWFRLLDSEWDTVRPQIESLL